MPRRGTKQKRNTHTVQLESAECSGGWSGRSPEIVVREASRARGVQLAVVEPKQAASAETEGLLMRLLGEGEDTVREVRAFQGR